MKKILFPVFLVMVLASCTHSSKQESKSSEEIALQETAPPISDLHIGCYAYQDSRDTILLELTDVENGIKGNLSYALAEKDKNIGTFDGTLVDNHLWGEYTFLSEGVESKREVAFMVRDHQLFEGYGELNTEGNAFIDKSKLDYSPKMPLSKIDCNSIHHF